MPDPIANGHALDAPGKLQQIILESDGVSVRIASNVPLDVAEGLLYRALAQMGRNILRAQLAESGKPKVEIFPSAQGFHPRGLV